MDARTTKALISIATVFVTGAAVGGFVGWVEGQRKGRKDAWIAAEIELDNQEDRLKRLYKIGPYSAPFFTEEIVTARKLDEASIPHGVTGATPEQLLQLKEHIDAQGYATITEAREDLEPKTLFETYTNEDEVETPESVAEGEMSEVTPNMEDPEPYVISEEEFSNDAESHTKISLSFYPTDRVVCDEMERIVDDVESAIGTNNLAYFSPENTVIYVRNNRLEADFAIQLEIGSYRENVLGEELPVMERRGRKRSPKDE